MTEVAKAKNEVANTKAEEAFISAAINCSAISIMSNNALKSLKLAKGMSELRDAMNHPEIKDLILGFQGTALGFITDKKYSEDKVLDCCLEALTAGAHIHGNEFNIIADRTYFAQSFFTRKVREYCTANQIKRDISYEAKWLGAKGKQSQYEVSATIMWQLANANEPRKQVKKYKLLGVSDDQVIGKATKRAHQWLYNELTNNNFIAVPDEAFDMPVPETEVKKPTFEHPDGLSYLIHNHGEDDVEQCLKALNVLDQDENLDSIRNNKERLDAITKNKEDFNAQIEKFATL